MDEPFDPSTVRRLVHEILESGTIDYPTHARKRMGERAVDLQDVENILRCGIPGKGEHHVSGAWRYKLKTELMCVVVEFQSKEELTVITAWRNDTPEVKR